MIPTLRSIFSYLVGVGSLPNPSVRTAKNMPAASTSTTMGRLRLLIICFQTFVITSKNNDKSRVLLLHQVNINTRFAVFYMSGELSLETEIPKPCQFRDFNAG